MRFKLGKKKKDRRASRRLLEEKEKESKPTIPSKIEVLATPSFMHHEMVLKESGDVGDVESHGTSTITMDILTQREKDIVNSSRENSSREGGVIKEDGGLRRKNLKNAPVDPRNWGYPGYLTEKEEEIYHRFVAEVTNKGDSWKETVFSFGFNEDDEHAYCRWLRARKYVLADVIEMVKQATELRAGPKEHGFYTAESALGVKESLFKTQYPQVFVGHAKNSCPLFISKPGQLNIPGLECITSINNMHKYQWHSMIHTAGGRYKARQEADPAFERFESVAVIDLEGLGMSILSGPAMDLVKKQSHVDSLCFPETMNRLVVINAPSFFSGAWRLIRRWLDARTANKIEIYSFRSKWEKRLKELIDIDQLPENYGGTGPSIDHSILLSCNDSSVTRRETELMTIKGGTSSVSITVKAGESMDVVVYTKSSTASNFSVSKASDKSKVIASSAISPLSGADKDTVQAVTVARELQGPAKFKVYGVRTGKRSQPEDYLIVGDITQTS